MTNISQFFGYFSKETKKIYKTQEMLEKHGKNGKIRFDIFCTTPPSPEEPRSVKYPDVHESLSFYR